MKNFKDYGSKSKLNKKGYKLIGSVIGITIGITSIASCSNTKNSSNDNITVGEISTVNSTEEPIITVNSETEEVIVTTIEEITTTEEPTTTEKTTVTTTESIITTEETTITTTEPVVTTTEKTTVTTTEPVITTTEKTTVTTTDPIVTTTEKSTTNSSIYETYNDYYFNCPNKPNSLTKNNITEPWVFEHIAINLTYEGTDGKDLMYSYEYNGKTYNSIQLQDQKIFFLTYLYLKHGYTIDKNSIYDMYDPSGDFAYYRGCAYTLEEYKAIAYCISQYPGFVTIGLKGDTLKQYVFLQNPEQVVQDCVDDFREDYEAVANEMWQMLNSKKYTR